MTEVPIEDWRGATRVDESIHAVLREDYGGATIFSGRYADARKEPFWIEVDGHPQFNTCGETRTLARTKLLAKLLGAERTFNDDQAATETLTLFQEQVIETIEAPEEDG